MNTKIPLLKRVLCGWHSPLGYVYSFFVGSAYTCPCCAFWRGILWGGIILEGLHYVVN
ncbi:hypothetical protein [Xenorhabdus bharatensis]|uniref:hypothetical protein n=1 Tax=Xenorhabdus bharatensis TaxID=3136256 RepID=UPI0030F41978